MSTALFAASNQARGSKHLVEFKAGKMTLGKDKMVQADKRKGLVYVYQSDDSLMHFCWKDRTSGLVEDDLMIFPEDIETKRVTQCTTGRVYVMRFKSSSKKFFFWMQESEANADKDDKLWKKVNDYLNNPPVPGSAISGSSASGMSASGAGGAGSGANAPGAGGAGDRTSVSLANVLGADFAGLEGSDLQSLIGSMSEQQLQMFLGNFMPVNSPSSNRTGSSLSSNQSSRPPSTLPASRNEPTSAAIAPTTTTTTATTTATTMKTSTSDASSSVSSANEASKQQSTSSASGGEKKSDEAATSQAKMQFSDFQNILGNIARTGDYGAQKTELDLSEIISPDVMAPILANKAIQERLIQHLPDSDILNKNEQELRTTLTTPQFKKAMSSFGSALQSGQLGPLMQQFDLPESVTLAVAQGNLEAFAKAMEAYGKEKKSKKKKDDEENKMDT